MTRGLGGVDSQTLFPSGSSTTGIAYETLENKILREMEDKRIVSVSAAQKYAPVLILSLNIVVLFARV